VNPAPLATLALRGAGGEPVDLARTLASHGVAALPPNRIDRTATSLETTLALAGGGVATVRLVPGGPGSVDLQLLFGRVGEADLPPLVAGVRHMLRLDDDLSAFYGRVARDPDLAWAATGAGRLLRSPTLFEDVAKTVCTTNCAWAATVRIVTALVEHLGEGGPAGRAFPTPAAMAAADETFYRDVVRAGYRGAYLRTLAGRVASRDLDLEALRDPALSDDEVERRLLALPGVGPYAAAHVMLVALGRHHRLVLDAWTRPTYARLWGKPVGDEAIRRRFRRYGRQAGLAFWLYVTRDWVTQAPGDGADGSGAPS